MDRESWDMADQGAFCCLKNKLSLSRSRDCLLTWSVCLFVLKMYVSPSITSLLLFGQLLRCADKCIVNIMRVYIERNNM